MKGQYDLSKDSSDDEEMKNSLPPAAISHQLTLTMPGREEKVAVFSESSEDEEEKEDKQKLETPLQRAQESAFKYFLHDVQNLLRFRLGLELCISIIYSKTDLPDTKLLFDRVVTPLRNIGLSVINRVEESDIVLVFVTPNLSKESSLSQLEEKSEHNEVILMNCLKGIEIDTSLPTNLKAFKKNIVDFLLENDEEIWRQTDIPKLCKKIAEFHNENIAFSKLAKRYQKLMNFTEVDFTEPTIIDDNNIQASKRISFRDHQIAYYSHAFNCAITFLSIYTLNYPLSLSIELETIPLSFKNKDEVERQKRELAESARLLRDHLPLLGIKIKDSGSTDYVLLIASNTKGPTIEEWLTKPNALVWPCVGESDKRLAILHDVLPNLYTSQDELNSKIFQQARERYQRLTAHVEEDVEEETESKDEEEAPKIPGGRSVSSKALVGEGVFAEMQQRAAKIHHGLAEKLKNKNIDDVIEVKIGMPPSGKVLTGPAVGSADSGVGRAISILGGKKESKQSDSKEDKRSQSEDKMVEIVKQYLPNNKDSLFSQAFWVSVFVTHISGNEVILLKSSDDSEIKQSLVCQTEPLRNVTALVLIEEKKASGSFHDWYFCQLTQAGELQKKTLTTTPELQDCHQYLLKYGELAVFSVPTIAQRVKESLLNYLGKQAFPKIVWQMVSKERLMQAYRKTLVESRIIPDYIDKGILTLIFPATLLPKATSVDDKYRHEVELVLANLLRITDVSNDEKFLLQKKSNSTDWYVDLPLLAYEKIFYPLRRPEGERAISYNETRGLVKNVECCRLEFKRFNLLQVKKFLSAYQYNHPYEKRMLQLLEEQENKFNGHFAHLQKLLVHQDRSGLLAEQERLKKELKNLEAKLNKAQQSGADKELFAQFQALQNAWSRVLQNINEEKQAEKAQSQVITGLKRLEERLQQQEERERENTSRFNARQAQFDQFIQEQKQSNQSLDQQMIRLYQQINEQHQALNHSIKTLEITHRTALEKCYEKLVILDEKIIQVVKHQNDIGQSLAKYRRSSEELQARLESLESLTIPKINFDNYVKGLADLEEKIVELTKEQKLSDQHLAEYRQIMQQEHQALQGAIRSLEKQQRAVLDKHDQAITVLDQSMKTYVDQQFKIQQQFEKYQQETSQEIKDLKAEFRPLLDEHNRRLALLHEKNAILEKNHLASFYLHFQILLNNYLRALPLLKTGLFQQDGLVAGVSPDFSNLAQGMIGALGDVGGMIGIPGAGLATTFLKKLLTWKQKKRGENQQDSAAQFMTIADMEAFTEILARQLVQRYEPQLELVKDSSNLKDLAECAVKRILNFMAQSDESKSVDKGGDFVDQCLTGLYTLPLKQDFWGFSNKKIPTQMIDNKHSWTESGIFQKPGIMIKKDNVIKYYVHEYVLFLMAEFNSEKCKNIKGNAVILINTNILLKSSSAYFWINGKIALHHNEPLFVTGINRRKLPEIQSDRLVRKTEPEEPIREIIQEALKKAEEVKVLPGPHMTRIKKYGFRWGMEKEVKQLGFWEIDHCPQLVRTPKASSKLLQAVPPPATPLSLASLSNVWGERARNSGIGQVAMDMATSTAASSGSQVLTTVAGKGIKRIEQFG